MDHVGNVECWCSIPVPMAAPLVQPMRPPSLRVATMPTMPDAAELWELMMMMMMMIMMMMMMMKWWWWWWWWWRWRRKFDQGFESCMQTADCEFLWTKELRWFIAKAFEVAPQIRYMPSVSWTAGRACKFSGFGNKLDYIFCLTKHRKSRHH